MKARGSLAAYHESAGSLANATVHRAITPATTSSDGQRMDGGGSVAGPATNPTALSGRPKEGGCLASPFAAH